jgi:hypothetical protein
MEGKELSFIWPLALGMSNMADTTRTYASAATVIIHYKVWKFCGVLKYAIDIRVII